MNTPLRRAAQVAVAAVTVLATVAAAPGSTPEQTADRPSLVPQPGLISQDYNEIPADRYEMANGCYTLTSLATGGAVARTDESWTASAAADDAERFHFRATDLGSYLVYAADRTFLAVEQGPKEQLEDGSKPLTDRLTVNKDTDLPRSIDDDLPAGLRPSDYDTVNTIGSAAVVSDTPSPASDWSVERSEDGTFSFTLIATGEALTAAADGTLATRANAADESASFELRLADGCAEYPEVQVNVDGAPHGGETTFAETRGYVDAHLHTMAYEFLGGRARCGQPWHRYGVEYAMVDCPDHEPGGYGAVLEMVVSGKEGEPHDTTGWPTFKDWPAHDSLTHEGIYYKWLERAWRGGLRMMTTLLVDNNVLCEIYPYKKNSCNEMDGVRLQAQRLHEFQDYIDAQSGGPGEGWFRIVSSPFEAREVVNRGQLAVVMGIEVSVLFDCGEYLGIYRCTEEQIDQQMDEVYDLGVRQMELVNKFDNALSGVAGDGGSTGLVVNNGNKSETGHYWQMQTCPEDDHEHEHHGSDKEQYNLIDGADGQAPPDYPGRDELAGVILQQFGPTGVAPLYPAGPHCNTIGLTGLGRYVIDEMIERGMLFDPDHMSARARAEAMDHIKDRGYHGAISSHSWASTETYQAIYEVGGMVTPMSKGSGRFVEEWMEHKTWANPDYFFGFGYGADMNGFAAQGGPRGADVANPVTYPFTGLGGVVIDRNVAGERVYDINVDGVAHYGLYPDWMEDAAILAGDRREEFLEDMARGSEAYLHTWERAEGVPTDPCLRGGLSPAEVAAIRPGMEWEDVLLTAGQPTSRIGSEFVYCTVTKKGQSSSARVVFDDAGTVTKVSVDKVRPARNDNPAPVVPDGPKDPKRGINPPSPTAAEAADHVHAGEAAAASSAAAGAAGASALLLVIGLGLAGARVMRRRPAR